MEENKFIKKYLLETTISANYPDSGGIAGDDDMPPGNINFGPRYTRVDYNNRLTGYNTIWDVDDKSDFEWNYFKHSAGQEDPDNYHPTLKSLDILLGDRFRKHIRKTSVPDAEVKKANIKNLRPEMNPKDAIGNDPNIETPEDIVNKIEKLSK